MPRVPTGVKVVSILGIIYAGLWLAFMPCGVFLQFHPLTPNPALEALNHDSVYMAIYLISNVLWLGMSVLLLSGSIASLKLKPWGRKAMLFYAWAHIAVAILNMVLTFTLVMPRMEKAFAADPRMAAVADMTRIFGIVGAVFGILFYGAISGVILFFFTRKVAVDAFNGIFPVEPNFPVDMPGDRPL